MSYKNAIPNLSNYVTQQQLTLAVFKITETCCNNHCNCHKPKPLPRPNNVISRPSYELKHNCKPEIYIPIYNALGKLYVSMKMYDIYVTQLTSKYSNKQTPEYFVEFNNYKESIIRVTDERYLYIKENAKTDGYNYKKLIF